jgi:ketopantoate hydroxymethyltransferase
MKKVTVVDIQRVKQEKKKIVTMTTSDFRMTRIIDKAGVDIILIGNSVFVGTRG